jgi:UDP-N-acetylmuramate dehydrogenase
LQKFFGASLHRDISLKEHCTFRIGGPAEFFVTLTATDSLPEALEFCHEQHLPVMVTGWGSNILFPDEGFHGLVIKVMLKALRIDDNRIVTQAGTMLPKLANTAADSGLGGLEFVSGIPGTAGGAVIMNAGFRDAAMGDVIKQVDGCELTGRKFSFDREHLDFRYRTSSLRNTRKLVTEIVLELRREEPAAIRELMRDYSEQRKNSQPLEYASAGSVFKNPAEIPAWKLIEQAGCKGLRIGNAQVSEKHGNFIVNLGGASYRDVSRLIDEVTERVYDTSGTMLELEILDLGAHPQRKKEIP